MNQTEQFLRFLRRRNEEVLEQWVVSVRIDGCCLVISQSWTDGSHDASKMPVDASKVKKTE
jgi:hypothetical protein